jgi:hypothetical protein
MTPMLIAIATAGVSASTLRSIRYVDAPSQ